MKLNTLRKIFHKLLTWFRMPFWKKKLCIEILYFLTKSMIISKRKPYRHYLSKLGHKNTETLRVMSTEMIPYIAFLRRFIPIFSTYVPWRSVCLQESLTAFYLLRKKNLPVTFYIGLHKKENADIGAHAWTRCGNIYVTGGNGSGETILTTYAFY